MTVHLDERRPQGVVAPHDLIEALLQRCRLERAGEAHGGGNVVDNATRLELVEEPQPLLGKGQRQLARARPRGEWRQGEALGLPTAGLYLLRQLD